MGKYIVTGTNKNTNKREVIGNIKETKQQADNLADSITFHGWKKVPKGVPVNFAKKQIRFKNVRVKKIL